MILKADDIHSYYGKSHILHGVSLDLKRVKLVCLLGRNGVGKSTTLKSIMGVANPKGSHSVREHRRRAGKQPARSLVSGFGYVPEDRRIFRSLTVHENLLIGI